MQQILEDVTSAPLRSTARSHIALKNILLCIVGPALLVLFMTGCGGGSAGNAGGGSPPSSPTAPSFTLSLTPSTVTVLQGGTEQAVQISVSGQNGFTGSVSVTFSNLPAGVTVSPTSLSIASGDETSFDLSASSSAAVGQQSLGVNGSSGALTADASLQLTVMGVAVQDPFHAIGGTLAHGFYDESRQLLFATNPGLNELDVISGMDFSIKARVPVPQPWGIDQMADGKTLVIGTQAQEILTVDEDTFAVTPHPYAALGNYFFGLFFPNVVALANGEVLIIGLEQGIDSDDIVEAGQYLYEWNSSANTFTQLEPTAQNTGNWEEVDSLARSADHKWAVFAADQFYLYSSDSSSLTTVPVSTVNPPQNEYGIRGYAMNADGSVIAVASAEQVTFLNRSFTVLGTASLASAFQTSRSAIQFSANGSRLYLEYPFPLSLEEIDATSYNPLGYVSATVLPDDDNLERMLTTDAEGRAYFAINGGLRVVELSQVPVPTWTQVYYSGSNCPNLNAVLPLNQSQQVQLLNQPTNLQVYVGGQTAQLVSNAPFTDFNIPGSPISGPADIECIDSSGNIAVVADGVSYGVDPVGFSANLLPPTGNPPSYLFGYGFFANNQSAAPSVTVGGETVASPIAITGYGLGTLEGEGFYVPGGSPGQSVSVHISSSIGSGTLPSVATYYPAPTIVPATGLLQVLYDSHRNLLYALKATEVDVLNPTTLQWQSPMPFPKTATGTFNTMALSPDGSSLVVGGLVPTTTGGTTAQLIVFNPDNAALASVFTYPGGASASGSIAITNLNTVLVAGFPSLAFDLTTSTFTSLSESFNPEVIRASADGSHVYGAALNVNSGEVFSVDPLTYEVQTDSYGYLFWVDFAVSPDGAQLAAIDAPPGISYAVGFFDSGLRYLNANVYPDFSPPDDLGVVGATYSPGGKVLVVPQGDSIEIWDATLGTLRARLMTPEELHVIVYPEGPASPMVALDPTGQIIYAVSTSGLTVLTLPEPLDQVPAMEWPLVVHSGIDKSALHGTISQRMAAMRNKLRK